MLQQTRTKVSSQRYATAGPCRDGRHLPVHGAPAVSCACRGDCRAPGWLREHDTLGPRRRRSPLPRTLVVWRLKIEVRQHRRPHLQGSAPPMLNSPPEHALVRNQLCHVRLARWRLG